MFLSADVISLALYCAQQLGVTLGVGAQTIMLVAYISAMRDGVVDAKEAQFARAVRAVLNTGLLLIILSGVGITILHILAGQGDTIFSTAYLFKWALIVGVLVFTLLKNLPQNILQGLAGGSWYALFVVHILAPVANWANLLTLYVVWMVGFGLCWAILIFSTKGKQGIAASSATAYKPPSAPQSAPVFSFTQKPAPPPAPKPVPPPPPPPPKPAPPPPPAPKPVAPPPVNLPVQQPAHIVQTLPQPQVPKPAAPAPEQNPWLPAIQIMPKTQGDADKHPTNILPK